MWHFLMWNFLFLLLTPTSQWWVHLALSKAVSGVAWLNLQSESHLRPMGSWLGYLPSLASGPHGYIRGVNTIPPSSWEDQMRQVTQCTWHRWMLNRHELPSSSQCQLAGKPHWTKKEAMFFFFQTAGDPDITSLLQTMLTYFCHSWCVYNMPVLLMGWIHDHRIINLFSFIVPQFMGSDWGKAAVWQCFVHFTDLEDFVYCLVITMINVPYIFSVLTTALWCILLVFPTCGYGPMKQFN